MHSAALKAGFDAGIPISRLQNVAAGELYLLLTLRVIPTSLDKNVIVNYPALNDLYIGFGIQMSR